MFEMMFSDGISRGMAHDAADHPRVCITKNGSALTARDWAKLKPSTRRRLVGDDLPESVRAPTSDEGDGLDDFRQHLRSSGLDESSIEEACEMVRRERGEQAEPEARDRLPVSGPGGLGGYRSGQSRQPGEKIFRSDFAERFPEAQRIGTATPGRSQFDGAHDRRTTRDRQIAADAMAPAAGARLLKKFPGIENVEIGDFPRRRL
jgi:hypothetical protein